MSFCFFWGVLNLECVLYMKKKTEQLKYGKSGIMVVPGKTLASFESLSIPPVQEVVLIADFRCSGCQKRVADIISKMRGETESVVVNVREKRVTLTCRYPTEVKVTRTRKIAAICKKPLNEAAVLMGLFRSSCSLISRKRECKFK